MSVSMHVWLLSLQGASPSIGNDGQPLQLSITITDPVTQESSQRNPQPVDKNALPVSHNRHSTAKTVIKTAVVNTATINRQQTAQTITPVAEPGSTQHSAENTDNPAHTTHAADSKQSTSASAENSASQRAHLLAQKQRIQSQLQQALRPHFYYPRMAIRRGWQGAVRLGLRIQSNGALLNIRVVSSSGYGILDRAAIDSLQQVKYLPAAVAVLNGRNMDVVLPVSFNLL